MAVNDEIFYTITVVLSIPKYSSSQESSNQEKEEKEESDDEAQEEQQQLVGHFWDSLN